LTDKDPHCDRSATFESSDSEDDSCGGATMAARHIDLPRSSTKKSLRSQLGHYVVRTNGRSSMHVRFVVQDAATLGLFPVLDVSFFNLTKNDLTFV
jgi:hypothetical protein